MKKLTITDETDMFVYFEIVKMINPKSIIDIGAFLMRIGAISRQVMSAEISADIELDAITTQKESMPLVYNRIYDEIYEVKDISKLKKKYDFAYMLYIKPLVDDKTFIMLMRWCVENTKLFVIEETPTIDEYGIDVMQIQLLQLDDKKFYLINC